MKLIKITKCFDCPNLVESMTSLICNRKDDVDFISSLPIGGVNGTVKYIFRKSPAKGKIFLTKW